MLKKQKSIDKQLTEAATELLPDIDYYINEQGLYVFTAHYLQKRGYCCNNGCKHCPYTEMNS